MKQPKDMEPCLCGEKVIIQISQFWAGDHYEYYGVCGRCGYVSKAFQTETSALDAWNNRNYQQ